MILLPHPSTSKGFGENAHGNVTHEPVKAMPVAGCEQAVPVALDPHTKTRKLRRAHTMIHIHADLGAAKSTSVWITGSHAVWPVTTSPPYLLTSAAQSQVASAALAASSAVSLRVGVSRERLLVVPSTHA